MGYGLRTVGVKWRQIVHKDLHCTRASCERELTKPELSTLCDGCEPILYPHAP